MTDLAAPEPFAKDQPRIFGRYAVYGEIASGGMATVHIGRLLGEAGFSRSVAVKRLHPQYAKNPEFVSMLLDEARLAARIRHPNVVSTLDVVNAGGEVLLVMDYVHGDALSRLAKAATARGEPVPIRIATAIVAGVLHGLHAAHEATSEGGEELAIVHRDVSPQNVIVGVDGTARVLDFGVAMASVRSQDSTATGQIKGKIAYMAPEQLAGHEVDRRADVWAAGVMLWEVLTGRRLFGGEQPGRIVLMIASGDVATPSSVAPHIPKKLDAIVMRALARDPGRRYATARDMAVDLEQAVPPATAADVGSWVEEMLGETLTKRNALLATIERTPRTATGEAIPASPAPARRLRWLFPAAGLVALSVIALVAWRARREGDPTPPAPAPIAAVTHEPPADPAPTAEARAEETPPSVETASPSATHAVGRLPAPKPSAVASAEAPQPPKGPDCSTPFTFVKSGDTLVKKWKAECVPP